MYPIKVSKLRTARVLAGLSQPVLGLRSGIKQARISLIERRLSDPSDNEMNRLSKALSIPIKDLF